MKKRYTALLAAFLLILAVCTYVSRQNYRRSLPVVQTAESAPTQLHYMWELTGTLQYDEATEYSIPVPVSVVQWAVRIGDRVTIDQPLLQVDVQQLHQQWLQCKINEETLETQINRSRSYTKELLELQLTELRETITLVEDLIGADGWLVADTKGIILNLQQSQQVAAGASLVTIGPDSVQKTITFPLTEAQAKYCKIGKELTVTLLCDGKSIEKTMPVEKLMYSAEKGSYLCTVSTDLAVDMMDAHPTSAVLTVKTGVYPNVIPIEAIVENNGGNASYYVLLQRETVMGTEYYTMLRMAYIDAQNESYAALNMEEPNPVVIRTSGDLQDYASVLLAPE